MNTLLIKSFENLITQKHYEIETLRLEKAEAKAIKSIQFKIINYKKALNSIKSYPKEITSGEQLKSYKGIGAGTINRINELLEKGVIYSPKIKIDTANKNKIDLAKSLIRITGVGPVKAQKLIEKNITLDILLKAIENPNDASNKTIIDELTHHQILGLKYFHDLEKRIPHSEINDIQIYLQNIIKNIDSGLSFIICGSYRRLMKTSGDIDILIYHENINTIEEANDIEYLQILIKILSQNGFLLDHLTIKGNTKYMGMFRYMNNPARRIDIRFIAKDCLGSAMLYFTGSGEFNKNMRTFALKNGYTINEYGIYKLNKDKTKGAKIVANTEQDIFRILGLKYIEPKNRLSTVNFI